MIRLLSGDCRDVLATLPAESVQCVVTSPPYFGLRDYGTALWDGGDAACSHVAVGTDRGTREEFIGAGTTALVADRLQRDVIGIDLNTQYTRMAMDRCIADAPLFTSFAPAEDPEDARMADLFAGDEYERQPTVVPERTAFRTGAAYVNQGPSPSNGTPDMAAD